MSIAQTLLGILLIAISSVVFAQTKDETALDVGANALPAPARSQPSTQDTCESNAKAFDQAEILTDTMGVDFRSYLTDITKTVRKEWYQLMPPSVYPPVLKQGKASIEFFVLKDGKLTGMRINASSGDVTLDRAAWGSISSSSPLAQLPKEFTGDRLGLRFYFFYNLTPESATIHISPCVDVRVAVGSTIRFSASGKDVSDTSLRWRVSGSGCLKSACGNVSDTGLYTAPSELPTPPTVTVEATDRRREWLSGGVKVTLVQEKHPQ